MQNFQESWEKALSETDIVRTRISALQTYKDTHVPYVLLSESSINQGDTVVRRGEVVIQKPSLILPPNMPHLEGFEFEGDNPFDGNDVFSFLLMMRGIQMPSMNYNNQTHSLDVYEGELNKAVDHYLKDFQQQENVMSGLLSAPEDVWQMSLLIFICSQVAKNATTDIRRLMDDYKKK